MTWTEAGIGRNAIYGSLADLRRLALIVHETVSKMQVGETAVIQHQSAPDAEYAIVLAARGDHINPSTLATEFWKPVSSKASL